MLPHSCVSWILHGRSAKTNVTAKHVALVHNKRRELKETRSDHEAITEGTTQASQRMHKARTAPQRKRWQQPRRQAGRRKSTRPETDHFGSRYKRKRRPSQVALGLHTLFVYDELAAATTVVVSAFHYAGHTRTLITEFLGEALLVN